MNHPHKSNPMLTGIILILFGIIFLSDSFHIISIGHLLSRWWPLILIIIGLTRLGDRDRNGGIFLIIVGALFQLSSLHFIQWRQVWRLWPVVLIITGVGLLLKRNHEKPDNAYDFTGTDSSDHIEIATVFTSRERQVTSRHFRGGEISTIFGNLSLDLRKAQIVPEGAHLRADTVFGSIKIFVSPNITVNVNGSQFLGRFDNFAGSGSGPALTINGDAVFGNIRISN